ncbi:MAG: PASTA domain-containing protein, partial [Microlunatus sp.]|nr:PASTA domain-containing protein [Microlunatus sp.]
VHSDVPPPSSLPTAGPIPDYLDALIARATARNADSRPHDARVLLALVRRVKSALQAGLPADPELTEDLTIPLRTARIEDDTDAEEAEDEPAGADAAATSGSQDADLGVDIDAAMAEETAARAELPLRVSFADDEPYQQPGDQREHTPTDIRFLSRPSVPSRTRDDDGGARQLPPNRPRHPSRHRARGWIALLIVLLLAAMAGTGVWYWTKGRFTSTPGLTSLSEAQAAAVARNSGFTVSFTSAYSETVRSGDVIDTRPRPGAQILRGGTIDAIVSKGPERYAMPTITGLTENAARANLQHDHLSVGTIGKKFSEKVASGLVINASFAPGTELKPDTKIDFVVSEGRRPIAIKNYEGKDAARAEDELKQAGFVVDVSTEHSDTVSSGAVISQSPNSGTGFKHDHIKLVKSLGPEMVTVPDVKSMGVVAAKKALQAKGFKVQTSKSDVLWLGLGYVASTDPAGGTLAPKGSMITINLV